MPGLSVRRSLPVFSGSPFSWTAYWAAQSNFYELWKVTGSGTMVGLIKGDSLTITGSGLNAIYAVPDTAAYKTIDTDYVFHKSDGSVSTACDGNRLIAYDFPRVIVYYLDVSPYTIIGIGILDTGQSANNKMRNDFHLSVWWDNTLSLYGNVKGNRGVGQSVWTPESVTTLLTELVGYWKLDESSGVAIDSHGSKDGTVTLVTQGVAGKIGTAYEWTRDASARRVNIGVISGVTAFSVSMWANRDSVGGNSFIFGQGGAYSGICFNQAGTFQLLNTGGSAICSWTAIWTDWDSFHHIVFVVSVIGASGKIELYFDGVSKGLFSVVTEAISAFCIGAYYNNGSFGGTFNMDGIIDEVGLWSKALSPAEVAELFNSGAGNTYPFA